MPFLPSEREHDACLDIVDEAAAARGFVEGMAFADFTADKRTNYAVVRCIALVSRACRRLGPALRARHPQVPWQDIELWQSSEDAENPTVSADHRVALDIVWRTVHEPLTEIAAACRAELDAWPEQP